MNNKRNQLLLGILVLLVGLFCFFQSRVNIDLVSMFFVALGFAFILLYKTKQKSWSLLFGAYLMYFGLNGTVLALSVKLPAIDSMFQSMVYVIPGIIFLILFYDKNKNGLLIPGSLLIAFGINTAINRLFFDLQGTAFYFVMSVCFFYIYSSGKYFLGKWPLYVSAVMIFFFAAKMWAAIF